jgi:hypothetical protein
VEFSSKETLTLIKKCGYFFVMSLPRTWKFTDDRALSDLVTHLPRSRDRQTWITRSDGRRRVYWVSLKHACLRHVGDVTMVLSKQRRNDGPSATIILVTHLPQVSSREVVALYTRRWTVELVNWELKSGLGLGHHQVSGDQKRSTHSVGIAVLAYLFLLRACHHEITPGHSWSIFQLQHAFRLRAMTNQVEHNAKVKMTKCRKAASYFALGQQCVNPEYILGGVNQNVLV